MTQESRKQMKLKLQQLQEEKLLLSSTGENELTLWCGWIWKDKVSFLHNNFTFQVFRPIQSLLAIWNPLFFVRPWKQTATLWIFLSMWKGGQYFRHIFTKDSLLSSTRWGVDGEEEDNCTEQDGLRASDLPGEGNDNSESTILSVPH